MNDHDNILDDLFHGCALVAYLDEVRRTQDWPGYEATRRRAFHYYEEALRDKHRLR